MWKGLNEYALTYWWQFHVKAGLANPTQEKWQQLLWVLWPKHSQRVWRVDTHGVVLVKWTHKQLKWCSRRDFGGQTSHARREEYRLFVFCFLCVFFFLVYSWTFESAFLLGKEFWRHIFVSRSAFDLNCGKCVTALKMLRMLCCLSAYIRESLRMFKMLKFRCAQKSWQ